MSKEKHYTTAPFILESLQDEDDFDWRKEDMGWWETAATRTSVALVGILACIGSGTSYIYLYEKVKAGLDQSYIDFRNANPDIFSTPTPSLIPSPSFSAEPSPYPSQVELSQTPLPDSVLKQELQESQKQFEQLVKCAYHKGPCPDPSTYR